MNIFKKLIQNCTEDLERFIETYKDIHFSPKQFTPKFYTGLTFIIFSFAAGWGGPIAAALYALKSRNALRPALWGGLSYGFSWLFFLAGIILCSGQSGVYFKAICARLLCRIVKRRGNSGKED